ncbi:hypothetical protein [Halobacillus litoralis]|uniref:LysM domain-containing protein n=1 Tax=Halobacillus litoralis TaxID=45668 RepID=A0A410MJE1_9BACI|nr:hypothetical protein [Halobacillus litoralis]QAS54842.1 hypothetical protein HLI_21565 [Halobacillus litoralis]
MLKTLAATGMAISIGMAGVGSVSAAEDASATVDLHTKVETAIDEGETVTKANLQAWAETNDWEMDDLQAFAKANGMTEVELQDWAEENGWSVEDSAKLDLDLDANVNLDNLLEEDEGEEDNHEDEDEGILDGILGGIL